MCMHVTQGSLRIHLAAQVQKTKLCLYLPNAYKSTPTRRLPLPDMLTPVPLPKAMFMYTVHMLLCSLHHAMMKKALAAAVKRTTTKTVPSSICTQSQPPNTPQTRSTNALPSSILLAVCASSKEHT